MMHSGLIQGVREARREHTVSVQKLGSLKSMRVLQADVRKKKQNIDDTEAGVAAPNAPKPQHIKGPICLGTHCMTCSPCSCKCYMKGL